MHTKLSSFTIDPIRMCLHDNYILYVCNKHQDVGAQRGTLLYPSQSKRWKTSYSIGTDYKTFIKFHIPFPIHTVLVVHWKLGIEIGKWKYNVKNKRRLNKKIAGRLFIFIVAPVGYHALKDQKYLEKHVVHETLFSKLLLSDPKIYNFIFFL